LEAEHVALEELIDAIDELHADAGLGGLGDLTDSLVPGLTGHLKHEEDAALRLIRRTLTARRWASFSGVGVGR
jgi:hypothetical protein